LLTLLVWLISTAFSFGRYDLPTIVVAFNPDSKLSEGLRSAMDAGYFILPKTQDLKQMNADLLEGSGGLRTDETDFKRWLDEKAEVPKIDYRTTVLTSAGWIAVMVGLSCWIFSRRDY
jgi:hypothetical protein